MFCVSIVFLFILVIFLLFSDYYCFFFRFFFRVLWVIGVEGVFVDMFFFDVSLGGLFVVFFIFGVVVGGDDDLGCFWK